jgi:hypothetical protein
MNDKKARPKPTDVTTAHERTVIRRSAGFEFATVPPVLENTFNTQEYRQSG